MNVEFDIEKIKEKLLEETTIYHYTKYSTALLHIIPKQILKFSNLENTNDPYEYKFALLVGIGTGETDEDTLKKWNEAHPVLDKYRRKLSRIACFSMNNNYILSTTNGLERYNGYGCCKPRMWAQYGENHYGICIAFNSEKLKERIEKYEIKLAAPMSYTNDYYKKEFTFNFDKLKNESIEQYCKEHINVNINDMFFKKHNDFQDENEYRIVFFDEKGKETKINIEDSIIALIIGDRFPDGMLPSLAFHTRKFNIPCIRVNYDHGNPQILYCGCIDNEMDDYYDELDLFPKNIE